MNTGSTALYGKASGANSPGVVGESAQHAGIYGTGKTGGYFTTKQAGTSWPGLAGVDISTVYNYNTGVNISTSGLDSDGVLARTSGQYSYGVDADSVLSLGISATTGRADHKWGVYTDDYIYAVGIQAPAIDIAEYMPVTEDVAPGTVLIIGADGKLEVATAEYDTRVAGIVSTSPAITLGNKEYGTSEEIEAREASMDRNASRTLVANEAGNAGEVPVAIAGRVPCKVDASYGAIHAGDLLTTSNTPGHAMKAEPTMINGRGFYPDGTILGKAMGSLESGTGVIEVLVTLQ
jgi:hypothetical protein